MLIRAIRSPLPRVLPKPVAVKPRRAGMTWWLGLSVLVSVVLAVALSLYAGVYVGQRLTGPGQALTPEASSIKLDPSYSQGYIDGIQAGRRAAEASPTRLTEAEVEQAVVGSLDTERLFVRGRPYGEGFKRGAVAGMQQRMRERFGSDEERAPVMQRVVVIDPAAERGYRLETSAPGQTASPSPVPVATPVDRAAIKRVTRPDGTVEYTNL